MLTSNSIKWSRELWSFELIGILRGTWNLFIKIHTTSLVHKKKLIDQKRLWLTNQIGWTCQGSWNKHMKLLKEIRALSIEFKHVNPNF